MRTLASIVLLAGCLSVPSEEAPMCEKDSDCDQVNGEICDDGTCWGNPPPGAYAAIMSPPASRATLVSMELSNVVINPDGWIDQLKMVKAVTYKAKLVCQAPISCETSMLSATITVTRPSTFPGGPGFRSVINVKNGAEFTIAVPPSDDYDASAATYTVTVIPDGRDAIPSMPTAAQVLPPLRTQLTIDASASGKVIELGGLGLPTITGVIKNDLGQTQANYRVVALGKWDINSAQTEVSTVDFTGTDGTFQLQLSGGLTQAIELVATPVIPPAPTPTPLLRPTLRFAANAGANGAQGVTLQWPAGAGTQTKIDIPVQAVEGNGEIKNARGARVIVSSRVPGTYGDAIVTTEGTTDDDGRVKLDVLDGSAFRAMGYRISVIPQANATARVMYDQPFSIIGPIPPQQLKTRVAIRGVVQVYGEPVKDMSITARPALKFMWSVDAAKQAFLTAIPPSTAVTPASGEFVVWVDPMLVDVWGHYDLALEAAEGSNAPNVTFPNIQIPAQTNLTSVQLDPFDLPTPAHVRSKIVDDKGDVVEGAELKLFRTEDFGALCAEVPYPPLNCRAVAMTATLLGRGASDEDGEVRLTLPR
jgi:hypothetical protein